MLAFKGVKMMAVRNVRLASTVVECAREAVKTLPYKNAVKFCGEKEHFNYTQFLDKIRMLSNGFYELGMKPGDSVLTWTDNRSETLASFYACAMTGLRCVTVDPSIKEADVLVDILREVNPSTVIYNPSAKKDAREGVLCELVPELAKAERAVVQEPVHNRSFPKLRTVCSTSWEHSAVDGVLNFRALLVDKTYPDLVAEVSKRLEKEPETVLLRSYAYSEGKVWKSRDITQKQVSDWAARVAAKLELTADSVVCLDLPLFLPLSLVSAVACMQKNAMLVVPAAERCYASTLEKAGKENATQIVTSEQNAALLKHEAPATLKMGLYPTECGVCKPMTGLKTVSF